MQGVFGYPLDKQNSIFNLQQLVESLEKNDSMLNFFQFTQYIAFKRLKYTSCRANGLAHE